MKPEWRTTTVVMLCQGMRETQEYGALPILADALEDAGCDDEKMLRELRNLTSGQQWGRRFSDRELRTARYLCMIESEEGQDTVRWIDIFADELCQTYERLMEAADLWAASSGEGRWPEYTRDDSERYKDVDNDKWKVFWQHYQRLTGQEVHDRECPFSCSC